MGIGRTWRGIRDSAWYWWIRHPIIQIKLALRDRFKKPYCKGDWVYYVMPSYHNGRENVHYRVYEAMIIEVDGSRHFISSGFYLNDYELYRTEKQALKIAKKKTETEKIRHQHREVK